MGAGMGAFVGEEMSFRTFADFEANVRPVCVES
jgi:hypothetical protein